MDLRFPTRLAPFVLVTAVMALFVIAGPHEPVRAGPFGWLDQATAHAVGWLFRLGGGAITTEGPVLSHPSGFAMEVYYRCTGFLPALFLAGAVLAFPAPARLRWKGATVGVILVIALNLGRLVGLLFVGAVQPELFDLAHRVVGEALIVLAVLGYWVAWARWALASRRRGS